MELVGVTFLAIGGAIAVVVHVFKRFFLGKIEYGVSIPELGLNTEVFVGDDSVPRALNTAVDIAEAQVGVPMHKTTAWKQPR